MIRAVLFDFDDTLVDFVRPPDARALIRGGAERCYAYLTAHGLPMPSFETFLRRQRRQRWTTQWADRLTGAAPDGRHFVVHVDISDLKRQHHRLMLAEQQSRGQHLGEIPR